MFIARQAIFNRSMNVYGYELLHRDSATASSYNYNTSPEKSTASVLNGLFELGIHNISSNKKSFINFDYNFLFSDSIELIDSENLIIEVLEDTRIDDKLLIRLKELKEKGYKIALDDFVKNIKTYPLIPIANIIKFDLMETPLHTIEEDVQRALLNGKILVAEKVETKEEYDAAREMGFHLFQGYFFQKPNIVGQTSTRKSPNISYLRIMEELDKEEASFDRLTEIVKTDINLAHRLLLTTREIKLNSEDLLTNIKQALVYMGLRQIRRWINILILQDLSTDKPDELTHLSLVRARFGELIAVNSNFHSRKNEIYGMCLFSNLDALLDLPIKKALSDVSLTHDVNQALINNKGPFSPILELIYSYEKGDWRKVEKISKQVNINPKKITTFYVDAIIYSQAIKDSRYNKF